MSFVAGQWKDLIIPASGLGTGITAPAMTAVTGSIETYGFQTGDYLFGSVELQHDYIEGSDLSFHIHWSPNSTNTGDVVFQLDYIQSNINSAYGVTALATVTQAGSGTTNMHQLASFGNLATGTEKIGNVLMFRLLRSATGNTFTGLALVHSIGIHYRADSLGSNLITSKN